MERIKWSEHFSPRKKGATMKTVKNALAMKRDWNGSWMFCCIVPGNLPMHQPKFKLFQLKNSFQFSPAFFSGAKSKLRNQTCRNNLLTRFSARHSHLQMKQPRAYRHWHCQLNIPPNDVVAVFARNCLHQHERWCNDDMLLVFVVS